MRGGRLRHIVLFAAAVIALVWFWEHRQRPPEEPPGKQKLPALEQPPSPVRASATPRPKLYVLAINGGGTPAQNYLSHLQHLQGVVDLAHQAGVPADHITVLAGDGSDPTPDLVVRVTSVGEEYWRLRGTPVEGRFPPLAIAGNSAVTGATLYPATRGSLSIWMLTVGQQLRSGDTLLLYVTDHGTMGATPEENRIVLWGPGQGLSVKELREALETLDPSVRVVALMSQCYSGGFAPLLSLGSTKGDPTGRFCGFFSARDDGKAYGCYPETRDDPKVGHSFAFLRALPASAGRFARAHELVVERDDTPDQPMRTSDLYVHGLLKEAAGASQVSAQQLEDDLLRAAWARPGKFDGEAQHLDRIAARFGLPSTRSQASVAEVRGRLQEWQSQLDDAAKKLGRTLEDLNAGGFRRFLSVRPDWQGLARPASLKAMDPDRCAQLGAKLVSELTAYAMKDTQGQTQTAAKAMWDAETQLVFRTKVRLAALARMALVLDSVAAAQYLDGGGNKREALDRILACEDLVLPIPKAEWAAPPPLPRLEDDLAQADMILQLAATDDPAKASALHLGGQAPELNLVPYRGETPSIGNGKPLLLFFWATWCKPCKAVVPKLLALARNRNLTVLAISHESESDLDRFFASSPDFPEFVSRDPEGRSISRLGQRTIPTFLLLDGQGKLASKIVHSPEELPPNGDE